MTETKFRKALRKVIVAELYESQTDPDRQMLMLAELAQAMGAAITFAYDGNVPAIRQCAKSSSKLIETCAIEALDGYLRIGNPLN